MKKKSQIESFHMFIGSLFVLIIIVWVVSMIVMGTDPFMEMIKKVFGGVVETYFNPDSAFSLASPANFERLNKEIATLLRQADNPASLVIPYTLGQYRLVGFNRAQDEDITNKACLGKDILAARPPECSDKACICLCYKDERCDDCKVLANVDYIITTPSQSRNMGKVIDGLTDPVTEGKISCLKIKGAPNENDHLKIIEPLSLWFGSQNMYLEKSEKEGKKFLFIASYDDIKYTARVYGGGGECGNGYFFPEMGIDYSKCVNIATCTDYMNIDLGCDWMYSCENSICAEVNELICKVKPNPYSVNDSEKLLCLNESTELSSICLKSDNSNSVPVAGVTDDRYWLDTGLCMVCKGLGWEDTDSWGWSQDSTINQDNCVNSAP